MLYESIIIKVDGHFYAYCRIQNEYSGNISVAFRRIYKDKDGYYTKVDGRNHYFNREVESYIARQKKIDDALDFYNKYHKQIFEGRW